MNRFTTKPPKIHAAILEANRMTRSVDEAVKATKIGQLDISLKAAKTTLSIMEGLNMPDYKALALEADSVTQSFAEAVKAAQIGQLDICLSAAKNTLSIMERLNMPDYKALALEANRVTQSFSEAVKAAQVGQLGISLDAAKSTLSIMEGMGMRDYAATVLEANRVTQSFAEAVKAAQAGQLNSISNALNFTGSFGGVDELYAAIGQSMATLSKPDYFSSAVEVLESKVFNEDCLSTDEFTVENEKDLQSTIESKNVNSFKANFERLPLSIQLLLILVFVQIFPLLFEHILLPQINNISANLITPHVDKIISGSFPSDRDKIKALKQLTFDEFDTSISGLRFISGDNVQLRREPNTKSEAIDNLNIGKVVVFLSKDRNWTEVMVQYDEGSSIVGWVHTRYVKKFNSGDFGVK